MLVLIKCHYDGDTYGIFNDLEKAKESFKRACETEIYHKVVLVQPEEIGKEFGFGAYGEIYGADVIEEYN